MQYPTLKELKEACKRGDDGAFARGYDEFGAARHKLILQSRNPLEEGAWFTTPDGEQEFLVEDKETGMVYGCSRSYWEALRPE